MKREFGVEANIGRPQVTYRETLRKAVKDIEGKFVRQSGGKGQYGHVPISDCLFCPHRLEATDIG